MIGARRCAPVAAIVCLLVTAGCGAQPSRPVPPVPPRLIVGFNDNSVREGTAPPELGANLAARAGARAVRVTLDWRGAEPAEGVYDFHVYDGIYRALIARGVRPLWTVLFSPAWSRDNRCSTPESDCHDPPAADHDAGWRRFMGVLARRYPRAVGIEVWNEPNLQVFWGLPPDPRRYAQLLGEAARAVHSVNRAMKVISGGLGELVGPGNIPTESYLTQMYAQGGMRDVDAIGVHPYPLGLDLGPLRATLAVVRAVRHRFHDDGRPLWVTEVGLTSSGAGSQTVSLLGQSQGLLHAYSVLSRQPDVRAMFIYTLVDVRGAPQTTDAGYGVVRTDGYPKPAYCALALAWGRRACAARSAATS